MSGNDFDKRNVKEEFLNELGKDFFYWMVKIFL